MPQDADLSGPLELIDVSTPLLVRVCVDAGIFIAFGREERHPDEAAAAIGTDQRVVRRVHGVLRAAVLRLDGGAAGDLDPLQPRCASAPARCSTPACRCTTGPKTALWSMSGAATAFCWSSCWRASRPAGHRLRPGVLHDWPDDDAAAILRTCRRAMTASARLILVESIRELDTPRLATQLDLHMLVPFGSGERTREEWDGLLASAGFAPGRFIPTPGLAWIETDPA